MQAESHDAATKIFGKDHPHLQMPGVWIEILDDHAVAWDVVTNASCIATVRSLVSVASTSALGHKRT